MALQGSALVPVATASPPSSARPNRIRIALFPQAPPAKIDHAQAYRNQRDGMSAFRSDPNGSYWRTSAPRSGKSRGVLVEQCGEFDQPDRALLPGLGLGPVD